MYGGDTDNRHSFRQSSNVRHTPISETWKHVHHTIDEIHFKLCDFLSAPSTPFLLKALDLASGSFIDHFRRKVLSFTVGGLLYLHCYLHGKWEAWGLRKGLLVWTERMLYELYPVPAPATLGEPQRMLFLEEAGIARKVIGAFWCWQSLGIKRECDHSWRFGNILVLWGFLSPGTIHYQPIRNINIYLGRKANNCLLVQKKTLAIL